MSNFFKRNRARVQDFLYDVKYIEPLRDSSYELTELKPKKNENDLRKVTICDIPFNDMYPISWIIDLEINHPSLYTTRKKPEKALVFFTPTNVEIILFELKSSLNLYEERESKAPGNLFAILEKYQSGIEQILLRLPLFLFDNEVNIDSVNFRAITFYNQEFINEALKRLPFYQSDDQVRLFTSKYKTPYISNIIKGQYPTEFHWIQNPDIADSASEFVFSLSKIIPDYELQYAQSTEIKCPREYV